MVSAYRWNARLQLRVERMHGDHVGAVLLQVSAGVQPVALLGAEQSGKAESWYHGSSIRDRIEDRSSGNTVELPQRDSDIFQRWTLALF
jgi:hypothetical protein